MQNEIIQECIIPNEKGLIVNPGWARTEKMQYERKNVKAGKLKKKEWDYYLFTNDTFGLAFTISDLGYIGLLSVSYLDFKTKENVTGTELVLFPKGKKFGLGTSTKDAHGECHTKKLDLVFENKDGHRHIKCSYRKMDGKRDFTADLNVYDPDMEAVYIATPWKEKKTAFYYNCKKNCLTVEGDITFGELNAHMSKENSFGVLDWGRGVWTYDNTWYWGTGSGKINGELFGFNLGYGFSDRSSASENALYYKKKVHKLSETTFNIPQKEDGSLDYLADWKITSDDGRFECTFSPIFDRNAYMNYGLILSDQHQVFGRMNGTAVIDDGEKVEIKDFICALEKVRNKY